MKLSAAQMINVLFRLIAALAYCLLGVYVVFWSGAQLGFWSEVPISLFLGILFLLFGFFRFWRAYLYCKDLKDDQYDA
jgi:fatty acid desaturase